MTFPPESPARQDANWLPVPRAVPQDRLAAWVEAYLAHAVTTAPVSRRAQRRDLDRFLDFMVREEGTDARPRWTPRLTRTFLDWLTTAVDPAGRRCWSDRTCNRTLAHLKTFARWVHKLAPLPLGDPFEGVHLLPVGAGLEVEKALTPAERRLLLSAADALPDFARRRDRRRLRDAARPVRKGARPLRDRAILYTLIETGMRRAAAVRLDLEGVDFDRAELSVVEKGGHRHVYAISDEGLAAIRRYVAEERAGDADHWQSPALFLAPAGWPGGLGRLSPTIVSAVWAKACRHAGIAGKSPHSARHAMGRHIIEATGNIAAVQRQLGHRNAAYSVQYARITRDELRSVLNRRRE